MDDHVERILNRVLAAIDDYSCGRSTLPAVQHHLEAAAGALDFTHGTAVAALQAASNDIELILFATSAADQSRAVDRCFATLRSRLGKT